MNPNSTELRTVHQREDEAQQAETTGVPVPLPPLQPEVKAGEVSPTVLLQWIRPGNRRFGRYMVGMEFDGRRLSVMETRASGPERLITRLSIAEWPAPPSSEALCDHLRSIIPRGNPQVRLIINSSRGIVRRFLIPRVPVRKRTMAALWQGKQLIPFPLDELNAYFGMEFVSAGERGWWVTLVALPRQDGEAIIEALVRLKWPFNGVSLAGTQPLEKTGQSPNRNGNSTEAVVFYSPWRNSFAIFAEKHLLFHYDLGPRPGHTANPAIHVLSDKDHLSKSWITEINTAINDAMDFYIGAHHGPAPSHLTLAGARESVGPVAHYVNEWEKRFPDGISVFDPLGGLASELPAEISSWLDTNMGMLTHAAIASTNAAPIDLTPSAIRKKRGERRLTRGARTTFVLLVAGTIAATGLLATQYHTYGRDLAAAHRDIQVLKTSAPVVELTAHLGELARYRDQLIELQKPSAKWMPWIKTVLGTLPANARLTEVDIGPAGNNADKNALLVRMAGTLTHDGPLHAIAYREWLARLESLTGAGRVKLAREQSTVWKGRQRSAFVIELRPTTDVATGWGK